ncbi:hypothetical protein [Aureimonas sp. SK2]|uniref:hypothetical protein n=1 Tax=Aureimonas sp. SK2 TaxID=3015992 RepID=UPI0024447825|nr:hypothetical protein [Aureimonas sp. SK2]
MATATTASSFKWEDYVPELIAGPATKQNTTGATSGTGQTQEAGSTTDSRSYTGGFENLAGGIAAGASTLLGQYLSPNGQPQVPGEYQKAVDAVSGVTTNGTVGAQGYADKLGQFTQTGNGQWLGSLGQVDVRDVGTGSWNKAAYDQYANPYQSAVYDTQMAAITKSQAEERAALDAKLAKARSFGSRGQIASGQLAADQASLKSETGAKLLSDGYDKAFAAFTSDAGRKLDADRANQTADISREQIESGNASTAITANQNADKMRIEQLQNSVANELSIANSKMSAAELLATLSQGKFDMAVKASGLPLERLTALAQVLNVGTTTSTKTNESTTNTKSNEQSKTALEKSTQQEGLSDAEKEELENGGGGTTTPGGTTGGGTTTPGGTNGGGGTLPDYQQPYPAPTKPSGVPDKAVWTPPPAGSPTGTQGTWKAPSTGNVYNQSGTKITTGTGQTTVGGQPPGSTEPQQKPSTVPPGVVWDPTVNGWKNPGTGTVWGTDGKAYELKDGAWKPKGDNTTPGTGTPGSTTTPAPEGPPAGVPPGSVLDPATNSWKDPAGNMYDPNTGQLRPTTTPVVSDGRVTFGVSTGAYRSVYPSGQLAGKTIGGADTVMTVNPASPKVTETIAALQRYGSTPYTTTGVQATGSNLVEQSFSFPMPDGTTGDKGSLILKKNTSTGTYGILLPYDVHAFASTQQSQPVVSYDPATKKFSVNNGGLYSDNANFQLADNDPVAVFARAYIGVFEQDISGATQGPVQPGQGFADGGLVAGDPLDQIAASYREGFASGGLVGYGFDTLSAPMDPGYLRQIEAFRRRPTKRSDLATMDLTAALASPSTRIDADAALEKGLGTYVNRVTMDGAALLEIPDEVTKPAAKTPDFTASDELFDQSKTFLDDSADTVTDLGDIDLGKFSFDPLATTRLGEGTGDQRYDALMAQLAAKENSPFAAIGKGYMARQARDLGIAAKRFDADKDVATFQADKLKSIASAEAGLSAKSAELAGADVERQLDQSSYQARLDALLLEPEAKRAQIRAAEATAADGDAGGLQTVWGKDADGNPVALQQTKDGKLRRLETPDGVAPTSLYEKAFETEGGKKAGGIAAQAIADAPKSITAADAMMGTIDGILNDASLASATGLSGKVFGNIPGTATYGTRQRMKQLEGQAFLQAFESLRGGGAITEIEGLKATQAIAALDSAQSEEDYRRALTGLKEVLLAGRARAQAKLENRPFEHTGKAPAAGVAPAAGPDFSSMSDEDLERIARGG